MEQYSGYKLASILEQMVPIGSEKRPTLDVFKVLSTQNGLDLNAGETLIWCLSLFDELSNEILSAALTDSLKESYAVKIQAFKTQFAVSSLMPASDQFLSSLKADQVSVQLRLLSDVAHTGGLKPSVHIEREELVRDANKLLAELIDGNMPEYARNTMVLQIKSLITAANTASIYPDDELRMRIKGIVADFLTDFEKFDDKYKGTWEKIRTFARKYTGAGAFALGLLADGTAVAGLLEPPQ